MIYIILVYSTGNGAEYIRADEAVINQLSTKVELKSISLQELTTFDMGWSVQVCLHFLQLPMLSQMTSVMCLRLYIMYVRTNVEVFFM